MYSGDEVVERNAENREVDCRDGNLHTRRTRPEFVIYACKSSFYSFVPYTLYLSVRLRAGHSAFFVSFTTVFDHSVGHNSPRLYT